MNELELIETISKETSEAPEIKKLETRNEDLCGKTHPETGVPYERDLVELRDGTLREGVFPEFPAIHETELPEELHKASDYKQKEHLNKELAREIENNPELREKFDERQLEQIANGDTPEGYVCHHHQEVGRMQVVNAEIHAKSGHTGGKEIWGGGS